MTYTELKQKHSAEISAFPVFFAFGKKQFEEGLAQLNVTEDELTMTGSGGYLKTSDVQAWKDMFVRFEKETEAYMLDDAFLTKAIKYELGNHEFGYTGDPSETLEALGLTLDNDRKVACFNAAKEQYMEENKDNF
jgi:hypothetical protein